jgi:hypothetical protein
VLETLAATSSGLSTHNRGRSWTGEGAWPAVWLAWLLGLQKTSAFCSSQVRFWVAPGTSCLAVCMLVAAWSS